MKNLPIIMKFQAVLAVLAIVAIGATSYMGYEIKSTAAAGVRIATTDMQAVVDLSNAKEEMERARGDMVTMSITQTSTDNNKFYGQMNGALYDFNKNMNQAQSLVSADYAQQIKDLHDKGAQMFNQTCAKTIQMSLTSTDVLGNQAAQQEALSSGCLRGFLAYGQQMSSVRNSLTAQVQNKYRHLQSETTKNLWYSILLLVLGIFVVVFGSYALVKNYIVLPLNKLVDVMSRISKGDFSVRIPETNRQDEIGKVARTVLVFQDSGLEKQKLEKIAKQAADEIESERSRNEAVHAEASAIQARVFEKLAGGLERLSSCDLMFRIAEPFSSDYEKLRIDFNQAMDILQKTMLKISENSNGVRRGSEEITQSADNLSRRTEQQAASLEQTAAALDEITATVRKASEGSNEARSLVSEAKVDAERSGVVVKETIAAMSGIESSSKKISNIIGVIDEIAFQTNLLALNAGVEAARAGDAGRGFAVVATEVRALAQRSADAAKEIKTLISASGAQVLSGVRLVNETGQALGRIVDQVARLNLLITEIASSYQEQSSALGEVNSAVNQMDQVTQQNAAMVEQSTAASHALAQEAEELLQLVGKFLVSEKVIRSINKNIVSKPVKPEKIHVSKKLEPSISVSSSDEWDEF